MKVSILGHESFLIKCKNGKNDIFKGGFAS